MTDTKSKKRVSKACDCCRKSKTKCDGMRPCQRCLEDGKICTYMNRKKEDKMYPASYVDLLETRVSVLAQTLTQLLAKSKEDEDGAAIVQFCQDPHLLDSEGMFDLNKVICELLSAEKLDNLAESSRDYSITDITNVTATASNSNPPTIYRSDSLTRSPSPRQLSTSNSNSHSSSTHHHYPLSAHLQHSDSHIHKKSHRRTQSSFSSSLTSPIQSQLNLDSPVFSPSSALENCNISLDITSNPSDRFDLDGVIKTEPLSLEISSLSSMTTLSSTSTLSPIENSDSEIFSLDTIQSFEDPVITESNWRSQLGFQSLNEIRHPMVKDEPMPITISDSFPSFNVKYGTIFE